MSLVSNPNPTRLGIYKSWFSNWYENNPVYSSLIYTDIYVNEFLNGIYYKLKMPSSIPMIRDLGYSTTMININSFLFLKKFRRRKFLSLYAFNNVIKIKYRKILLLFKKTLKNVKIIKNIYPNNKRCYILLSLFIDCDKYINYSKTFNKNYITNDSNSKWLHNINYRLYNNKNRKVKKKVSSYIKKNILLYNKYLNDKYFLNNNILKNKIKSIINYIYKYKHDYNNSLYLDMIKKYKMKRKLQVYKYKCKIKRFDKFRVSNKRRKLSRRRINNRKIYYDFLNLKNHNKFKKIYSISEKKRNKFININKFISFFQWLLLKLVLWFNYISIQSFYIFYIANYKYILGKKIQFFDIFYNNRVFYNIKKICAISLSLLINNSTSSFLKVNKNYILGNFLLDGIKTISSYIKTDYFNYSRIKSYYRLRKRQIRNKKRKEYEFKYNPRILILHFRLLSETTKWLKIYFSSLFNKQLNLKINATLIKYLDKPVLFINKYNKHHFNRLDDTKLLSDYIKLMMKYEYRNPTIMKKIVKIHSSQRYKCRKRTYFLMNKLFNLKKRINIKLNNFKKKLNFFFFNYKVYISKRENYILFSTKKENKYYRSKYKNIYKINKNKKKINNNVVSIVGNNLLNNSQLYRNNNLFIKIRNKIKLNLNNLTIKNLKILSNNKDNKELKKYYISSLDNWRFKFRDLAYKRYPLIGIRIECNGPTRKGRRTQIHLYNEWVDFYRLPGKMPLVTIMSDVSYWQTYGLTQRASIGIKLWMYFHSPHYSENVKKLLNKE